MRTYRVYVTGRDCDGNSKDVHYDFVSIDEAKDFASNFNYWSDGLLASDPVIINDQAYDL